MTQLILEVISADFNYRCVSQVFDIVKNAKFDTFWARRVVIEWMVRAGLVGGWQRPDDDLGSIAYKR